MKRCSTLVSRDLIGEWLRLWWFDVYIGGADIDLVETIKAIIIVVIILESKILFFTLTSQRLTIAHSWAEYGNSRSLLETARIGFLLWLI